MKAVLSEGTALRKVINCLKDLITGTADIRIGPDGLSLITVDSSKVALIVYQFSALESFELTGTEETETESITFDFPNFNEILKMGKADVISLEKKDDSLLMKTTENGKRISVKMALAESELGQSLNVNPFENIAYDTVAYIDCSEFQKSIKDLSHFGEKCLISFGEDSVIFKSHGKKGSGEIVINDVEIEHEGSVSGSSTSVSDADYLFSIKYLNTFSKAGLNDEIILRLSKGNPLCFEYRMESGSLRFYMPELDRE
jgi:proliferating cell nuclear antigen PCNA